MRLTSLFAPGSIAIVGASDRPGSRGASMLANLKKIGYAGTVYPVNPKYQEVDGARCFNNLADLPNVVEAVAIATGRDSVLGIVENCAAAQVRAVAIVGAGYAESDGRGRDLQVLLTNLCQRADIQLSGPNCLGVWNRLDRMAYWLPGRSDLPLSGVGLIIQSGALASALMDPLAHRGIGFDCIATTGNEAILTAGDYLAHMVADPRIRAVGMVVETFRNAPGVVDAARRAAQSGKRVICLKLGRSRRGQAAAAAHTASIAGEYEAVQGILPQLGVSLVTDLDQLLESVVLLAHHPQGIGSRVAFTTVSGAGAGLIADLANDCRLPLPELSAPTVDTLSGLLPGLHLGNPVDIAFAGDQPGLFAKCISALAADDGIDAVAIGLNVPRATDTLGSRFYEDQINAGALASQRGKRVVAFSLTSGELDPAVVDAARSLGIPVLLGARQAITAIKALATSVVVADAISSPPDAQPLVLPPLQPSLGAYDEVESKRLLRLCGVPVVDERLASTPADAVRFARELGFPVTAKTLADGLTHKARIGAVQLNLRTDDEVRDAYANVIEAARRANPRAHVRGVVIQRMVEPGLEMIIGMKRDEIFGPMLLVGLGGVFVEVLRDFQMRPPPLDSRAVREMLAQLRGTAALQWSDKPGGLDIDALVDAVIAFSNFVSRAADQLESIDINPLIVLSRGRGVVAVDAVIVPSASSSRAVVGY